MDSHVMRKTVQHLRQSKVACELFFVCGATTHGKPFIHLAAVDLRGKVYELLRQNATRFLLYDVYRNPDPLQFDGPGWKQQLNILLGMSRKLILLVSKDGQERFTSL